MTYKYNEILLKYKTRTKLKKALEDKELFHIKDGIYADERVVDPLIIYCKKYPKAIITMDSAFYFYHLTDVIPDKIYLATDRKAYVIKDKNIFQLFLPKDILNIGNTTLEIQGGSINIYDRERLLIELIRKRKQIPFDYYKEIISNYREIADELDMYKIEEYLTFFKNGEGIFEIMQREVF